MTRLKRRGRFLLLALALSAGGCGDDTQVSDLWSVDGDFVSGDGKKAKDLSGIACDRASGFPRQCVIVNDEAQSAQWVTLYDGRLEAGRTVRLTSDTFDGEPLELDGEGAAFSDGDVFVIGSHGHPRDRKHKLDPNDDAEEIAAKITASSRLLRFKMPAKRESEGRGTAGVVSSKRIREAIAASPILSPFADTRLDRNGLTIEGLAVIGNRIFIGFRAPLLDGGKAAIMSLAMDAVFGSGSLDAQVSLLDLDGRGVRDLSVRDGNIVILAGPSSDEDGEYAVYLWNQSAAPALLGRLPHEADEKPEAILPLDDPPGAVRFLVISDGVKDGAPRAVAFKR